jgi:hypothetical protein
MNDSPPYEIPEQTEELRELHRVAVREFGPAYTAVIDERRQCFEDRRFCDVAGAAWEGSLSEQYENKPKFEVNKGSRAVQRIIGEFRKNEVEITFEPKSETSSDKLADAVSGIYRADVKYSRAQEAFNNAFDEAVKGGIGAWKQCNEYVDEGDPDNDEQRICFYPIYDADLCVFPDLNAKRADKSDARRFWVICEISHDEYKRRYGGNPSAWDLGEIAQYGYEWRSKDTVTICEYFTIEEITDALYIYEGPTGEDERFYKSEIEKDDLDEKFADLKARGFKLVKKRNVKTNKVRMLILSGAEVLEDCGHIAGSKIPIVMVYGQRSVVDGIERAQGHIRCAKDSMRLKNMNISKIAEIASYSSVQKPIFAAEQILPHMEMWQQDNVVNNAFLLAEPLRDAGGNIIATGPLQYTQPPQIPPAIAALHAANEQDIQEILGQPQSAETLAPNASGVAVGMVQDRLDSQTFIYLSNYAEAQKYAADVWLSQAKDVYTEDGRKLKVVDSQGKVSTIEISSMTADNGVLEKENDLSRAEFDVSSKLIPASNSRRNNVVRTLESVYAVTRDPADQAVLLSSIMMNIEGEGLSDLREYYRKKLVRTGVIEPTEEDKKEMQAEAEAQRPDANQIYLQAEAEKSRTASDLNKAKTILTMEQANKTAAEVDGSHIDNTNKLLEQLNPPQEQPQQQVLPQQ